MGQVSLLEDIEKALENLRVISDIKYSQPTEVQVAAQKKHLQREQERLSDAARKLTALAQKINNNASRNDICDYLYIQKNQIDLRKLKTEKDKISAAIKVLEKKYGNLNRLAKEIEDLRFELAATRAQLNSVKKFFEEKISQNDKIKMVIEKASRISAAKIRNISFEKHEERIRTLKAQVVALQAENDSYKFACQNHEKHIASLKEILILKGKTKK